MCSAGSRGMRVSVAGVMCEEEAVVGCCRCVGAVYLVGQCVAISSRLGCVCEPGNTPNDDTLYSVCVPCSSV